MWYADVAVVLMGRRRVQRLPAVFVGTAAAAGVMLLRSDGTPSLFFDAEELRCRCGGRHGVACDGWPAAPNFGIDARLVDLLDRIRDLVGPVYVTCGYRCVVHNRAVGGRSGSLHLVGKAADIVARTMPAPGVQGLLETFLPPVPGVGAYASFTHVDVRDGRARWDG